MPVWQRPFPGRFTIVIVSFSCSSWLQAKFPPGTKKNWLADWNSMSCSVFTFLGWWGQLEGHIQSSIEQDGDCSVECARLSRRSKVYLVTHKLQDWRGRNTFFFFGINGSLRCHACCVFRTCQQNKRQVSLLDSSMHVLKFFTGFSSIWVRNICQSLWNFSRVKRAQACGY